MSWLDDFLLFCGVAFGWGLAKFALSLGSNGAKSLLITAVLVFGAFPLLFLREDLGSYQGGIVVMIATFVVYLLIGIFRRAAKAKRLNE